VLVQKLALKYRRGVFLKLDAPIKRVTGWDIPAALQYEKFLIPDTIRVLDAMIETLQY